MTKFFVPACGTEFTLDEPWTFFLYAERRNEALFKAFGRFIPELEWVDVDPYWSYCDAISPAFLQSIQKITIDQYGYSSANFVKAAQVTFMPGTKLKVARVYIRNGQKGEYDSITLTVHKTTHPLLLAAASERKKKKMATYGRFWVKLADFNKIHGTILKENVRQHIVEK